MQQIKGYWFFKLRGRKGTYVKLEYKYIFEVNSKGLSKMPCANMYLKVVLLEIKV
jgi:hypothetical protein